VTLLKAYLEYYKVDISKYLESKFYSLMNEFKEDYVDSISMDEKHFIGSILDDT